jgi:hypothetical protein
MKLAHLDHLPENGKQVGIRMGSWTWSKKDSKDK